MDISIIIPVYNAVPLLERCLDSIFNQTTLYSYEVILVDDGSTDNSVEVIKARPEKILYCINNRMRGHQRLVTKGWNYQKVAIVLI